MVTVTGRGQHPRLMFQTERPFEGLFFGSWDPRSAGIFRGERPLCTIMEIACQAVKDNVYEGTQEGRRGKEEAVADVFFV